jgi:hypothetical protein
MSEIELPLLPNSATVGDAWMAMIERSVSGVVVDRQGHYHLIHFSQITELPWTTALDAILPFATQGVSYPRSYSLSKVDAVFVDFHELADFQVFASVNPGFSCQSGSARHYYPPNQIDGSGHCVVAGCPGTTPK